MLMANPEVARAAAAHGAAHRLSADKVWSRVEAYIDEIIPSFNILAYYRFGYVVSHAVLKLFYKVSAEHHPAWSGKPLPRDAIVIYLDEIFDRAWKMLRMRKILVRSGDGYVVLPKNRGLVSYYANSIAHLLGPFEQGVRERDALPSSRIVT